MSNVVPFTKPTPVEEVPHGAGEAFCMQCSHTWAATAPLETVALECPECHTMKGRFTFPFAPPTTHLWTCGCKNQLFNVAPEGIFCPNCGSYQSFPKDL